jgi:hypothetical protein
LSEAANASNLSSASGYRRPSVPGRNFPQASFHPALALVWQGHGEG